MAQGFQCWDSNGNIVFDTSSRTGRIIGSYTISAASGISGSATVPLDTSLGTPFIVIPSLPYVVIQQSPTTTANVLVGVDVSISGNTINWAFPFTGSFTVTVYYGIY